MGRQQTLGQHHFLVKTLLLNNLVLGNFFDKPATMKSAPPQQASLNELWKKKKKQPSPDPAKMEVSSDEEAKPVASTSGTPYSPVKPF